MASLILGVSGRKRSGKDSLAARLVSDHGFTRIAFADPLKAVAQDVNPWIRVEDDELGLIYGPGSSWLGRGPDYHRLFDIVDSHGWETAKEFREVRRILQDLGVAVRDHVGDTTWMEAALDAADRVPGPVVIPDVRFPNEAAEVEAEGGYLVRVSRPGLPADDLHVSETALDDLTPDFVVRNDGTLDDLHAEADRLAETLRTALRMTR